jgi:hypothetical protein
MSKLWVPKALFNSTISAQTSQSGRLLFCITRNVGAVTVETRRLHQQSGLGRVDPRGLFV